MARDLYTNVERIISSNTIFLKKKACIVAAKLIDKDPDLAEFFLPYVQTLINDMQPAILLGATRLMSALYAAGSEHHEELAKSIPKIVSHLKRVSTAGYMHDYDVGGTADPFLQVALLGCLRTLALLSEYSQAYMEDINDVLAQVASTAESGKNAAHAVLYECIKTIFAIPTDESLKILGVNLLGKFLSTKDNNTRYVALDSLLTVINTEPVAVQRHRQTIVACLADGDVSIRRRALELSFAILNDQNIRVLAREILNFLQNSSDNDLKPYATSQLAIAANKYAPNDKWRFLNLSRMLKVAGNYVTSDIVSNILASLLQCSDMDLKSHVVLKVYSMCQEDNTQYGLCLIAIWAVGEYAELILGMETETQATPQLVTEKLIIQLFNDISECSTFSSAENTQITTYIMTAVIKLLVRFTDPQSIESLRMILNSKTYDNDLEIQVRAVEYQNIFVQDLKMRKGLLTRMPPPPLMTRESLSLNKNNDRQSTPSSKPAGESQTTEDLLLDLMDDDPVSTPPVAASNDLLSDIFGDMPSSGPAQTDVDKLAGAVSSASLTPSDSIVGFSNDNIKISFVPQSFPQTGQASMDVYIATNNANESVDAIQLLIAVPKTQKLTISTSGGDSLSPHSSPLKQVLLIVGKPGSKIKLRVKARYTINGDAAEEHFDFAGFSKTL